MVALGWANFPCSFVCLASAEAVDEACIHFDSIFKECEIAPGVEDVLGKSGHVNELEEFIENFTFLE